MSTPTDRAALNARLHRALIGEEALVAPAVRRSRLPVRPVNFAPDYLHPDGRGLVPMLEALRARGWFVHLMTPNPNIVGPGRWDGCVVTSDDEPFSELADTPAEALALACLRALEAEGP